MALDIIQTDVFICGGGPVGLLTAYMLARMGVKTCIIEKYDKAKNEGEYGRAAGIFSRSQEMLDQIDLLDEMLQMAFVSRGSVNLKEGRRAPGRGISIFEKAMQGSFFDHQIAIRQKYTENVVRRAYERCGGQLMMGWTIQDLSIDEHADDGLNVTATIRNISSEKLKVVKSQKMVGADGGHSTVRQLASIPMEGDSPDAPLKWVRIDAVIKTNMPDARKGSATLESPTHGNVLYICLDHSRTRIGYPISAETLAKCDGRLTDEIVKHEATLAMKPYSIEFITVDWWTSYDIKQKVARDFSLHHDTLFLAGDACHTHSSGAAQGLNTGLQDAVNLSWKLSGVLRGLYNPLVLSTYQAERKPIALSLIKTDKRISSLISGNTAPQKGEINSDTSKDSNALLAETFQRSAEIIVGLGIKYAPNILNKDPSTGTLPPGHRAPDALLRSPGSPLPTRLYSVTKNYGCFYVLVFAGYPFHTLAQLQNFRTYIDSPGSFTRRGHPDAIRFVTIISGNGPSPDEALGIERFGNAYYDYDGSAHARYGISEDTGAAVILRPDGYFAFATMLDRGEEVGEYFERILKLTGPRAEANGVH